MIQRILADSRTFFPGCQSTQTAGSLSKRQRTWNYLPYNISWRNSDQEHSMESGFTCGTLANPPGMTRWNTPSHKMPSVRRSAPRSEAEEHRGWWASHTSLESQSPLRTTRSSEGLLQLSPAASFVSARWLVSLRSGSGWCHLKLLLGAHHLAGPTMKSPPAPAALPTSWKGIWGSGSLHGIKQECKVNEDLIQPQVFLTVKNKRGDY